MNKVKICILDLGWGNVSSVATFFLSMGYSYELINKDKLNSGCFYEIYIICGVGSAEAFELCSDQLVSLKAHVNQAKVVIGFCLGAHFLCESTEESNFSQSCLKIVPVEVVALPDNKTNIGYREMHYDADIYRIYHCHSFGIPDFTFESKAYLEIAGVRFVGIGIFENIVLIQGHPEKSGTDGQRLIRDIINVHT